MARILLIDDDVEALVAVSGVLRTAGHEVVTARTGQTGLDSARDARCDLILSELLLPDINGLDILRELRQKGPVVPFVMTGSGTVKLVVSAMRLGATHWIEKPFVTQDILDAVQIGLATSETSNRADGRTLEAHAAVRWARAVVGVLGASSDPRTMHHWGRAIGAAAGTLRGWCRSAGVSPKRSLDLARLLRAVSRAQSRGWQPKQLLDVVDGRTLSRMLRTGGLERAPQCVTVQQFLANQSLIADRTALDALRHLLLDDGRAESPASNA